jgi:ATP synthase protein I
MTEQDEPPSLENIEARLRDARAREDVGSARGPVGRAASSGMALGLRLGTELVSGLGVGAGLGWALDRWLGTRPWAMVVGLFFGGAAGVVSAYRAVRGLDETVGLGTARERAARSRHDN